MNLDFKIGDVEEFTLYHCINYEIKIKVWSHFRTTPLAYSQMIKHYGHKTILHKWLISKVVMP